MLARILNLPLLAALALATPAFSQQLVLMDNQTFIADLTPDGSIVCGTSGSGSFIWHWKQDPAPTLIAGGRMKAISDDGTVACGDIYDSVIGADVAAIWTQAGGWLSLGWLPSAASCPSRSNAYDISGDGSTIVGLSWFGGCDGRGFRWTAATGMQELEGLANGHNRCSTISSDGSTLGGFAQGTFSRTPAFWSPNTSGAVVDANLQGEVYSFTSNGGLSVGTLYFSGGYYSAFVRNQQTGFATNLGKLHPSGWAAAASGISEDANTIVGFDYVSLSRQAWVWTSIDGMISLNTRLTALGLNGAPPLQVCTAVSDDGRIVVGAGEGSSPFASRGFIVELPAPAPQWTNLGNGLEGTTGVPVLLGSGPLTAGSDTSVVLTNGKPSAAAAFVIGLTSLFAPFKQGVLVPFPDLLLTISGIAPSGSIGLQFVWPAGLPAGVELYWQCLILDPGAPKGFAMSNGLKSLTP